MAYPATPKTWVAGDVLTAAQLNAELRDALLGAFPLGVDAWTGYTPTLTQSGAVTKTVTYAKYQRIGRTIFFAADLAVTGAGTGANEVLIGLPAAAAATSVQIGVGMIYDTSAGILYSGTAGLVSSTTVRIWPAADGAAIGLGVRAFVAALAAGDLVRLTGTYEAAT
jgi:hypothetical protein